MASRALVSAVATLSALLAILPAQFRSGGSGYELNRQAVELDLEGKGAEARQLFQKLIDSADTPAARANAQRAMAMSWAFESNCQKTGEYEQRVIDYWITREKDEPYNAFYQEGEMADEAGRVCIDSGDVEGAFRWYQKGHDFGLKEPGIPADRKALWEFRWEHAQARIAARRGNRTEAEKHVAAARAALDKMTDLRAQQEDFFPYLRGYIAFYLGDYNTALQQFEKVPFDPFNQCMLGQIYEKLGDKAKAMEYYRRASMTNGHNPPAAYARSFTRKKIG
jgi:tetratricopeptide (TPR) repeat protein